MRFTVIDRIARMRVLKALGMTLLGSAGCEDGPATAAQPIEPAPPAPDAGQKDAALAAADGGATTPCALWRPEVGAFERIYDPSVGESSPWYINDHTIVRGPDDRWHLFGITHAEPAAALDEKQLAHASSPTLTGAAWTKLAPALVADPAYGETLLWAPHVLLHEGRYYMFYCAGGPDSLHYRIRLATSEDLVTWERLPQPLFDDGYDARDPYVLRVGERWVMYYTATRAPEGGAHVVAARTSGDLREWSERSIVYEDPLRGTFGGPTESPFVVARSEGYYLLIGPWRDYASTRVLFSRDPLHFAGVALAEIDAHAPEVVRDLDGREFVSHAGWGQGGVYLAPLTWRFAPPTPGDAPCE